MLVAQSCLTLCDSVDGSPPGSSVHGISQAKYGAGKPFPSPGDPPNPRIEPGSPVLQMDSLPSELPRLFLYTYAPSFLWGFFFSIRVYHRILSGVLYGPCCFSILYTKAYIC